jgi:pyruvate dehydrogenase E1 component alpha subunit
MTFVDAKTYLSLYRAAKLIRRTQEALMEEYASKQEMRCPMHFCIGEEAPPTALSLLLRPDDYIVSHYRSHGYYLAKGAPLSEMLAEFHGKATGSNRGYAGSMELAHEEARFYSGAIVGGPLSIAMGMAFGLKYKCDERTGLVVAVTGDGSLDEGVSYESLNLAALHGVPLLIICHNNHYAAHTAAPARTKASSIIDRVKPFGLRAETTDGMDVIGLHLKLRGIVDEIRATRQPYFLEVVTYRFCPHVGPEDDEWLGYRPAEEIAIWKKRDPVPVLREGALRAGIPDAKLRELESTIEEDIRKALASARADAFADYGESLTRVWDGGYSPIVKKFWEDDRSVFDPRQSETRLKSF